MHVFLNFNANKFLIKTQFYDKASYIYINLSLWYISIKKLSKEIFLKIFPQRDYIIISKTVFVQDNNNIIVPLLGTHK